MRTNKLEEKKHIKKIADYTADYYGFEFIEIDEKKYSGNEGEIPEKEKIHILKTFAKKEGKKRISSAKLLFYNKPILKKTGLKDDRYVLDIINLESAVAEALVIKTAVKILEDEGYSDILIKLNSIGDRDSQKNFKKKLGEYYRENQDLLRAVEKKKKSSDPLSIYYSDKEYLKEINEKAPKPIDNLSEASYEYFKKVTEYIDNFGINYEIDPDLVGEKRVFSKIIFKIFARENKKSEHKEVAFGGRYDELAGEVLKRKKISAVGLNLSFKQKKNKKIKLRNNEINIHLLKIGSTAELKFLEVVDIFKKLNLPVKFSLSEKKISKQLKLAEADKADKLIIFGEKEAQKNKVIVRDADDFSQKEIYIKDLEKYLKKI